MLRLLKPSLFWRLLPLVAALLAAKYAFHVFGWEFLELNTLFTAIISANVFLLGFLLAGVLTDFKESEKLPSELAVHLDAIADEAIALLGTSEKDRACACLTHLIGFIDKLKRWFHKEERTSAILGEIRGLTRFFQAFEAVAPANYIVRLKQEQSSLRRVIHRIDTIRDTSFVSSAYRIAEFNSTFLIFGLLVLTLEPFSNSLYFTGIIATLFIYMLALIRDLDNPFGFYDGSTVENVHLKLLLDAQERLRQEIGQ